MQDEFSNERLPDLPNVGYATANEQQISDMIMFFMREVERQRWLLLEIVVHGRQEWIKKARKTWGVRKLLNDDKLGEMWDYFARQAGPDPQQQLVALAGLNLTVKQDEWR